jgi:ankyrin repeat protein
LGANVNQLNLDNCTCAHGAAFYKNIRVLEMLIENKCDVSVTDISGKNILHLLCKDSLDEDYTPNASNFSINEGTNNQNESEQNISKQEQNQNLIKLVNKLIVEMKMDPNLIDLADFTSLMYACEQENLDLIQILIDNGANVNFMNKDGVTCMILAIVNSCSKVVKLLLKCGFDLHKNLSNNFSYITDAAYLNDTEILNTLLDAGCDVNETKEDENGVILNPLWASCERGNLAVVEILLSKGARTIIREG